MRATPTDRSGSVYSQASPLVLFHRHTLSHCPITASLFRLSYHSFSRTHTQTNHLLLSIIIKWVSRLYIFKQTKRYCAARGVMTHILHRQTTCVECVGWLEPYCRTNKTSNLTILHGLFRKSLFVSMPADCCWYAVHCPVTFYTRKQCHQDVVWIWDKTWFWRILAT